ncbi:MAG TPA: DUF2520 domain-containing protein, partial [Nannocystis exedens]|nr:DUF2520 domain-containing protein [Nannocystis exedens]
MSRPVLAVLGGSFNPPHIGHALIPSYLRLRGLATRIVVAPCWSHPFAKSMASFDLRLQWTRAAMSCHGDEVLVSDLEAELAAGRGQGVSYTIELLEALAQRWPGYDVRLVIGTDIVARGEFDRWHRVEELRRRFPPIIIARAGYADPDECVLPEVSSTAIRALLADPSAPGAREALAASVPAALLPLLVDPSPGCIWLIGHGHVAMHAELWLRARGWTTRMIGARALVAGQSELAAAEAEPRPDAIWVLCGDPAIPAVAAALVEGLDGIETKVPVLHAAGALPAASDAALGCLARTGYPVATLHPICSLRREQLARSRLATATFGVEGDDAAMEVARRMIGEQPTIDLRGLDEQDRRAYHGACALAANHLGVLYGEASAVVEAVGCARRPAEQAIGSLLRSSLSNLLALGVPAG